MHTCSSCRHWRPIRGTLTEMVCGLIRTNAQHPVPRIVLHLIRQRPTDYPMILATPADFGCTLHEERHADPGPRNG